MFVSANIKIRFDFITDREEIQDIILSGEYFRENVVECEVIFDEQNRDRDRSRSSRGTFTEPERIDVAHREQ